jgi:hypothetical protein
MEIMIYGNSIRHIRNRKHEAEGTERIVFQCFADITELEALAHKAAGNKSMRSKMGPVTVKIIERSAV